MEELIQKDYIVVRNDKLIEDCKYKLAQYNKFKNNEFTFKLAKRITENIILNYNKIFIDSYSFHAVAPNNPDSSYNGHYVSHVKETYKTYYRDDNNKILLIMK